MPKMGDDNVVNLQSTTPLLDKAESTVAEGDSSQVKNMQDMKSVFWVETKKLWKLAGPITFNLICNYGINSVTSIFAGHIGEIELSAVAISLSVIGTFTFGFMLGMGSALETLCGQAFGAGQVHMLGVYMQRSWIILLVSGLFLLPIYIFATPVLTLLGQQDDIADLAGEFTLYTIPNIFALAIIFPAQKFLQAQSKLSTYTWIGFVALVLHITMLSVFIYVFDWGILGAAVAYNITRWGIAIVQVIYCTGWCKDGWKGFSMQAFDDIFPFVRLSLASAVMMCLEIWYSMSIILLTGHLSNAVLAVDALSICMNLNGYEVMIFVGINAAISVRVSNALGSGRPRTAKYSVYVTVFQSLLIGILAMAIVLVARDYFAVIFTSSTEVQDAVASLAWLLGITMILNSIQPVISGVAIGGGWQGMVAYINLGSYYIFGLPLGFVLGYVVDWGVKGIWGGMICGMALQTLILMTVLYKTNWNKEVEQSAERMRKWGGKDNTAETTEDSNSV